MSSNQKINTVGVNICLSENQKRKTNKQQNKLISMLRNLIYSGRRRLKGIHSRPDTNRTGAEGSSFYYTRLLHCLDQMLAVMSLSQHRVSSSKTVRPRALCGARCIGHAVSTWSAVCSEGHTRNSVKERDPICAMAIKFIQVFANNLKDVEPIFF